jgi:hypothetical protein
MSDRCPHCSGGIGWIEKKGSGFLFSLFIGVPLSALLIGVMFAVIGGWWFDPYVLFAIGVVLGGIAGIISIPKMCSPTYTPVQE